MAVQVTHRNDIHPEIAAVVSHVPPRQVFCYSRVRKWAFASRRRLPRGKCPMAHSLTAHSVHRLRGLLVSCAALALLASAGLCAAPKTRGQFIDPARLRHRLLTSCSGRPRGSVGVRGSMLFASAGSDIYDFMTESWRSRSRTSTRGSFGAELGVNVSPRLDVIGAMDLNGDQQVVGLSRWEDNRGSADSADDRAQTDELYGVTRSSRCCRAAGPISRLAWIPRHDRALRRRGWRLRQVQIQAERRLRGLRQRQPVFTDTFTSRGWAPTCTCSAARISACIKASDPLARRPLLVGAREARLRTSWISSRSILAGSVSAPAFHIAF